MRPVQTRGIGRAALPARTHLRVAVATLLSAALGIAGLRIYAEAELRRQAPTLTALNLPEEVRSATLQRRILAMPRCLPVYGSSELSIWQPTRADLFFHQRADGFDVRLIGQAGDRCLHILQQLAALGPSARGRKMAVFLSPGWFLPDPAATTTGRATPPPSSADRSTLQLNETLLNGDLPLALRRRIAARLLAREAVIRARSPLSALAVRCLAATSPTHRALFAALTPLFRLQNLCLSMQENIHWLGISREHRMTQPDACRRAYQIRHRWKGWARLQADVARAQAKGGAMPAVRLAGVERGRPVSDRDADFLDRMQTAPEWGDLDLLLEAAPRLGVRLLVIDQPINGAWSDARGVTAAARQVYYRRIAQAAAAHKVTLRDFSTHEEDPTFFLDEAHPSAEAWVWYDQALAEFYRQKGEWREPGWGLPGAGGTGGDLRQ